MLQKTKTKSKALNISYKIIFLLLPLILYIIFSILIIYYCTTKDSEIISKNIQNILSSIFFSILLGIVATCAAIVIVKKIIMKPLDELAFNINDIDFDRPIKMLSAKKKSKKYTNLTKSVNNLLYKISNDTTTIKQINEKLIFIENQDALTGLHNLKYCSRIIDNEIQNAREDLSYIGIYLVSLDKYSNLNLTLGYSAGNNLLMATAQHLMENLGDESIIGRAEGGNFIIVSGGYRDKYEIYLYADKIMSMFDNAFALNSKQLIISASIGVSIYPDDAVDTETLIRNAELAMSHAKCLGGNICCRFEIGLQKVLQKKLYIENRLRSAVNNDCSEFRVYFQPKVIVTTGEIYGCEALVRWLTPDGIILPNEFIRLAEETGLILPLSRWVLKEAFRCNKTFEAHGIENTISINIPAQVLLYKGFIDIIKDTATENNMNLSKIDIEITETTLINDTDKVNVILESLRRLGLTISIDDFGTGYSSLSHLKKLSIDRIKIDRSFIVSLNHNDEDKSIVNAMVAMAKNLNMLITAEGVENKEQYEYLKDIACEEIQGYYISKPLCCEEYIQFIKNRKKY